MCGIWLRSPSKEPGTRMAPESRSAVRAWRCASISSAHSAHIDKWCAARRCALIRSSPSTNAAIASVDKCSVDPNWRGAPTGAALCEANGEGSREKEEKLENALRNEPLSTTATLPSVRNGRRTRTGLPRR
ncbi:Uncharacterised protein [Mycobacteroides abscessus subsp. abscessus]|nr:Uncharacterised protein [Mycobacteroides abscessus subsp. abscessus]